MHLRTTLGLLALAACSSARNPSTSYDAVPATAVMLPSWLPGLWTREWSHGLVDLPGDRRVIESIAMWYSKGEWRTRPSVRVHGVR